MRLFHLFGVIRLCQMFFPAETWVSHGGEVEVNFKTLWCSRVFPQLWDVAALGVVWGAWSTLVLLRWLVDVKYGTWSNAAYYGNNPCMKNHRAAVSFVLFTPPILLFSFFHWGSYSLFIAHGHDQPFPMGLSLHMVSPCHCPICSKGTFPGNSRHLHFGNFSAETPLPQFVHLLNMPISIYILYLIEIEALFCFCFLWTAGCSQHYSKR